MNLHLDIFEVACSRNRGQPVFALYQIYRVVSFELVRKRILKLDAPLCRHLMTFAPCASSPGNGPFLFPSSFTFCLFSIEAIQVSSVP